MTVTVARSRSRVRRQGDGIRSGADVIQAADRQERFSEPASLRRDSSSQIAWSTIHGLTCRPCRRVSYRATSVRISRAWAASAWTPWRASHRRTIRSGLMIHRCRTASTGTRGTHRMCHHRDSRESGVDQSQSLLVR